MSLIFVGISSGIIAAIWAAGSMTLKLGTFAGFLAWSTYFAAGRGKKALKIGLITNLSGILWGFLEVQMSILIAPYIGDIPAIAIATGLGSALICLKAKIPAFSFIPGTFIGCSAYFAAGQDLKIAMISMICGSLLGYASDKFAGVLSKITIIDKKKYINIENKSL